jgi:hypothetical protein
MRDQRFTFLCTEEEKSQLRKLSNYHHRSQSDVVRLLLRQAIGDLAKESSTEDKPKKGVDNEQSTTKG